MITTRPGNDAAAEFARLSGMPAEYFDKLQQAFPDGDINALRVFLALRGAARRIDTVVAKWLDAYGVTATKVDILHLVSASPQGTTAARLREHLMMTQPNVTFVLAGLERDGLIRRSAAPGDKRSVLIRLTPAGKRLIAGMTGEQLKALKQSASILTDVQKDTMIRMLSVLTRSFEETTPPRTNQNRQSVDHKAESSWRSTSG